jgi:hypothetical protein
MSFFRVATAFNTAAEEALWDVVFVRLGALQEYGWHAGLEPLMWASDRINGSLAEMDWPRLQSELASKRPYWIDLIITSAKSHNEFFPVPQAYSDADRGAEE